MTRWRNVVGLTLADESYVYTVWPSLSRNVLFGFHLEVSVTNWAAQ